MVVFGLWASRFDINLRWQQFAVEALLYNFVGLSACGLRSVRGVVTALGNFVSRGKLSASALVV